ncbi:DUF1427 family protein (plasmid) [Natrinema zhouii]|uniref:XapX domain-containing protein n=1 Tax=Natrinema zhouii TaxID=1710539 RepID=UPI001D0018FC|nr:DUF1427 family protein [Natrinema zhouii]UHQ98602.1 DUF1427 family protein [Natrinema zhouii]
MNTKKLVLAILAGFVVGAGFTALQIPSPVPPNFAGLIGIVGIYLGYVVVERLDIGFDLPGKLGLR